MNPNQVVKSNRLEKQYKAKSCAVNEMEFMNPNQVVKSNRLEKQYQAKSCAVNEMEFMNPNQVVKSNRLEKQCDLNLNGVQEPKGSIKSALFDAIFLDIIPKPICMFFENMYQRFKSSKLKKIFACFQTEIIYY